MLIKHTQTKELKLKISSDVVHELESVTVRARECGYDINVNASVEKHLISELAKVRKQMDKSDFKTSEAIEREDTNEK